MTPDEFPSCVAEIHPKGEDRKKYMFVAEETPDHVTFCCRRCSEMARTPVIQVRTLRKGWERAHAKNLERNPAMDFEKQKIVAQLQANKRRRSQAVQYDDSLMRQMGRPTQ